MMISERLQGGQQFLQHHRIGGGQRQRGREIKPGLGWQGFSTEGEHQFFVENPLVGRLLMDQQKAAIRFANDIGILQLPDFTQLHPGIADRKKIGHIGTGKRIRFAWAEFVFCIAV